MSQKPVSTPRPITLEGFAHALGAPLCALEVVLGAKDALPKEQAELLEAAVERLRHLLAQAQGHGHSREIS